MKKIKIIGLKIFYRTQVHNLNYYIPKISQKFLKDFIILLIKKKKILNNKQKIILN
jgi:hypothetical protein